jgi:hypothetical protein
VTSVGGTVTQVNDDGSFVLQTTDGQTLTVQNPIQVGATVKLQGLLDALQGIITKISQLTVQNNRQTPPPVPPPSTGKVSISSIDPAAGTVGTSVTLKGSGFAQTNTVNFGYGAIPNVASADGVSLTFSVPGGINPPCYYSKPQCLMPSRIIEPGMYPVSVTNENGTSNEMKFTAIVNSGLVPIDNLP